MNPLRTDECADRPFESACALTAGRARVAELLTVALLVIPVVADWMVSGTRRVFGYLAADAFYYLTIARNIAAMGRPSFDQVHDTNGFHPLWQGITALVWAAGHGCGLPEPRILWVVVVLTLALLAFAVVLLGRVMRSLDGRLPILYCLLPLGALGALTSGLWAWCGDGLAAQNRHEGPMPVHGTMWSYLNGMESSVLLAAYAAAAYAYCALPERQSRSAWALLGACLALVGLARLDHMIFPVVIFAGLVADWIARGDAAARTRLGWTLLPIVLFVAPVIAWNWIGFGNPVPVSGQLKSSFPAAAVDNISKLAGLIAACPARWLANTYRFVQLLVPAGAAAGFLVWLRWQRVPALVGARGCGSRLDEWLGRSSIAVILLAVYDFTFVRLMDQGHWYVPVSVVHTTLVVARVVHAHVPELRFFGQPVRLSVWLTFCGVLQVVVFWGVFRQVEYHANLRDFYYEGAPKLRAQYGSARPRILEVDDGIVAFATGFPAMSAMGYVLDPEAARAKRQKRLFRLARERGFDRLASVAYLDALQVPTVLVQEEGRTRRIARWKVSSDGEDLTPFVFEREGGERYSFFRMSMQGE